jgi:hypothetical protein
VMSKHEPDQDIFRSVLPEEVDWQPFPAFPPSAQLAVVVGHPINNRSRVKVGRPYVMITRIETIPAGIPLRFGLRREILGDQPNDTHRQVGR